MVTEREGNWVNVTGEKRQQTEQDLRRQKIIIHIAFKFLKI